MQLFDVAIYILAGISPILGFFLYICRLELKKWRQNIEKLRKARNDLDLELRATRDAGSCGCSRTLSRDHLFFLRCEEMPTDQLVDIRAIIELSLEENRSLERFIIFRERGGRLCVVSAMDVVWPHNRDEKIPIDLCGPHRFLRRKNVLIVTPLGYVACTRPCVYQ